MGACEVRPIPGYPKYLATSEGRIIGPRGYELRPSVRDRYEQVGLYNEKGNPPKTLYVHRLIAAAFHGMDLNDSRIEVNHLDRNTLNNRPSNLVPGSNSDNQKHSTAMNYPLDSLTHKTCRKCLKVKIRSEFVRNGYAAYCKPCFRDYMTYRRRTK